MSWMILAHNFCCCPLQLLNVKMIFTWTFYSAAPTPTHMPIFIHYSGCYAERFSYFLPFAFLCKQRWIYFIVWQSSHATTKIVQMKQVVNYIHTSANRLWILYHSSLITSITFSGVKDQGYCSIKNDYPNKPKWFNMLLSLVFLAIIVLFVIPLEFCSC